MEVVFTHGARDFADDLVVRWAGVGAGSATFPLSLFKM